MANSRMMCGTRLTASIGGHSIARGECPTMLAVQMSLFGDRARHRTSGQKNLKKLDQPANLSPEPAAMSKSGSTNAGDRRDWTQFSTNRASAGTAVKVRRPRGFSYDFERRSDTEAAIDVIYQEYVLRRGLGESPAPAEFIRRPPSGLRPARPPVRGGRRDVPGGG